VLYNISEPTKEENMTITKAEFEAYCDVQESGVTNMFNAKLVAQLSGLERDQVVFIMKNYGDLKAEYRGE
jgi:hypothetical protein